MLNLKTLVLAVPFIALVNAHGADHGIWRRAHHHNLHARQGTSSSSTTSHGTTSGSGSTTATRTTTTSTGSTSTTLGGGSGVGGTLPPNAGAQSVNPTAVPIASILPTEIARQTVPLLTTAAAGSKPSGIPGAPPLPDISSWDVTQYPPLDKAPPVDSPEVAEWIAEVASSGIEIPTWAPMKPGDCAANPGRVNNATECWWTCGHCARTTDVTICEQKLTWGSSFDDGPAIYTPDLLDYLSDNKLKTTFFVVGSRVASRPSYVQAEYVLGHQIAVHTWSHTPLTTQTTEQVIAELGWTRKVIRDVIGLTPNFMRPPYGDIDDRVRAIALAMGMTPVIWTVGPNGPFDTFDWEVPGNVVTAAQAISQFETILQTAKALSTGFIVLEHDLFQQTVDLAIGYFLPSALAQKLNIQPIVGCMGLQAGDAYIETNNNSTHPPTRLLGGGSGGSGTGTGFRTFAYENTAAYGAMLLASVWGLAALL